MSGPILQSINSKSFTISYLKPQKITLSEFVDQLTRRSQQIAAFPLSGRMVPEYESHEIREIIEGPYRIIYFIAPKQIEVLTVIHGAQQIPFQN